MDLTLSPEQELVAATARAFVARACPPSRVRAVAATPLGFDRDLWREMAALGWAGLVVPEPQGGAGRGLVDAAVLCEALGFGPVPSPLVWTTAAALLLAAAGDDAQRAALLPGLASGEVIATFAVVDAPRRATAPTGRAGTLRGTKVLVPWAGTADVLLVTAPDGVRVVDAHAAGIRWRRHADLGADPLFELELVDVEGELLATDADTVARALDAAAMLDLAATVGACERVVELTVRHACEREQFGRPIGSFQAVAHRCVDMRAELDACRYLAFWAVWALDGDGPAELEVGAAKAYADGALRRLLVHAHQVHGAVGFSTEHDLHLFTRRAKAFELSHGTTTAALERVAGAMGLQ
jgi:alkylation response protein AidB-like acyl-CoA dehydrogenase